MAAGSYRFEFSNGVGCYEKLNGKGWNASIPIRFTVWAVLRHHIFPEADVPTFGDIEEVETAGGPTIHRLFAKNREEGSVEVTLTT